MTTVPVETIPTINDPPSLEGYFATTGIHIIIALALGLTIETITEDIQHYYNLHPAVALIFQLTLSLLVLYYLEVYWAPSFASQWSLFTPGLFFGTLFFLVQDSIFKNFAAVARNFGLLVWG